MKIKLTLTPEDAAIVHEMYLRDELDDIGVVGLSVPDDKNTDIPITLPVIGVFLAARHILAAPDPSAIPRKKVVLEICEETSRFDQVAFLTKFSRIFTSRFRVTSIGPSPESKGSTYIELEAIPNAIMRLLKVFKDGLLDELNIAEIMTVADFSSDDSSLDGGSKDYWKKNYTRLLGTRHKRSIERKEAIVKKKH